MNVPSFELDAQCLGQQTEAESHKRGSPCIVAVPDATGKKIACKKINTVGGNRLELIRKVSSSPERKGAT